VLQVRKQPWHAGDGFRRSLLQTLLLRIVSTSCFGSQASRHFRRSWNGKNIRRPTHVFTLKNPGASTFSM